MEKEPLLPFILSTLPEDQEVTSELKDRLIFGPSVSLSTDNIPSSSSATSVLDALCLSSSPKPSSPFSDCLNHGCLNHGLLNHGVGSVPFVGDPQQQSQQAQWLIDPLYSCGKTNLHRSRTAPAMSVINDVDNKNELDKPEPSSQSIVKQAFVLLVVYLLLGVLIFWYNRKHFTGKETIPVVDALYFCIVTMCTIGYGDITPDSTVTKLFSICFVLVGFGFIDILLSGMVSYVLDLQESHLLETVKAGKQAQSVLVDVKKGRMRIRMKVGLALGVVILCIGIGVGFMHFVEQLGWVDSLYLSVMSVTTVGYGDAAFKSLNGRIFASIWLLVSTLAVARAFLYLAEARVDKRHRTLAKWVLGKDMTVSQFLAADIDHDGFVRKSEYVIYKLKEMGKVSDKDIRLICQKFDQLDTGNCGKITLADLAHGHL